MSLRNKIVLILASIAVLYVTMDVVLLRFMVSGPFEALEEEQAAKDVGNVHAALDGLAEEVGRTARTWGLRNDLYRFMEEREPGFRDEVLVPDVLRVADIDLLFVLEEDGDVVWGRVEDGATREPIRLREFPGGRIGSEHPILANLTIAGIEANHGMMFTERGPMLVASHPIRDAAQSLPSRGTVIAGRFFDERMQRLLRGRLAVDVEIWSVHDLPERELELKDRITTEAGVLAVEGEEEGVLTVYKRFEDIRDNPNLILSVDFPRDISASGDRIFDYALLSTVATALLIIGVLLRLLQAIVIRPLSSLTAKAVEIGRTDDITTEVEMDRGDEIGLLSREFGSMLGKLAKSREQVVKTARMAGMSEIATGVLHNVGNVLNSVVVSTSLVKRKAEKLAVTDLEAMTTVLGQHEDDLGEFITEDPQGRQFLPFLSELTREMSVQRAAILNELVSLGKGVEHIQDLVRSQQSYAGMSGVFEPTDLAEQVDAAVAICKQAYGAVDDLEIVREYEALPKVPMDRNKLMEILVNLIQNARQVLEDAGVEGKRIVLRVRRHDDDMVRIEVEDNGPGISEENLARIFNHGFTTRRGGHGFGLHVSANAATEMKARLWAESEGLGEGAMFVLSIPNQEAPAKAA